MCCNCLNLSGNGWVPFLPYANKKKKKRETAMCSTLLFCFSLSNFVQHKDWRKSLSGSMFILEEQAFEDDRWPQVDNDDDLIRSLSLVWSRPKLLHPTDGINLATLKKSRAIFCSFLPPLLPPHNFSFLSSKYHLQSETEKILPLWHRTTSRLCAIVAQACIPFARMHLNPLQLPTCGALKY